MTEEIIMLGTGSAFPRKSYNSCFIIRTDRLMWLTDGGGGNGIFNALASAGINPAELRHLFVTHSHTDHILGIIWIIRRIVNLTLEGAYSGRLNVYANSEAAEALTEICRLTFLKSYFDTMVSITDFHIVAHGDRLAVEDVEVEFIDCRSENVMQTGYIMHLPSGRTFATLGDEALNPRNADLVAGVDYLHCGAFCLYADRERFRPYEKHHFTVRDVAREAEKAAVKTLILSHSEDVTDRKRENYTAEAAASFSGRTIIPADGERIDLIGGSGNFT